MAVYADLFRYRELFLNLFRRELRVKYRGSALGLAWTLINPIVLMLAYWLIFSVILRAVTVGHYPLFLLTGLLVWIFFQSAIQMSCSSLLGQASLVKQVRLPRQLLPVSVVATNLVTMLVMLAVVLPLNLLVIPETRTTFWAALPLFIPLTALVTGFAIVLASVTVIFRDVEHLIATILLPVVHPDADLLSLRRDAGHLRSPEAGRRPLLREPGRADRVGDPRPALLRRAAASSATSSTRSASRSRRSRSRRSSSAGSTTSSQPSCSDPACWSERLASSPSSGRPSGSCARPGARCPATARSASGTRLFEVCRQPELCAEVTLEPVRVHGVDAAVMFADIMLPILGMGIDVDLVEGVGPVVAEPVRTMADVERLRVPDPEEAVPFILEAVRLVRGALAPEQALVGFCGGPFTVAGYLVEGKPTREFSVTKRCMYGSPEVWHALCEKLAATSEAYLRATVEAGADAVQLFDSWVGALSRDDYEEFVAPYSKRILEAVDVPTIHFGTGTSHLLETMTETGGDVIGLDWRVRLDEGWERVGHDRGVQGNLDPALLLGPFERVESAAIAILDAAGGRPGHIFNLGHGVLPDTDPADLKRIVELVHERTAA